MPVVDMVELVGFVAGIIICVSTAPYLRTLLCDPTKARFESIPRNVLIVTDNLLWLVYGLLVPSLAISVMSAIAVILNAMVLYFALSVRRRERRIT